MPNFILVPPIAELICDTKLPQEKLLDNKPYFSKKNMMYTTVKCTLNKFCNNDYVKSKLNDITLNVNKIIFETYLLANLHIVRLLDEGAVIPALNQGFFQNAIALTSKLYNRKEKKCNDSKLQDTFDCYTQMRPNSYKVSYRDFITSV